MKIWLVRHSRILSLIAICLAAALIYRESFLSPFFQDDKFYLNLKFPTDFFRPIPPVHYHPISNQLFYTLSQLFFGYNYLGFHLVLFVFFCATIIVIANLSQIFLKDRLKSLLVAFFWGLNVSLFPNFYWVAISYFVLGAFFFFSSLYYFLLPGKKSLIISFILFLLSLGSNELGFIFPAIVLLFCWYRNFSWKRALPFVVITPILFFLRTKLVRIASSSDYTFQFNSTFFATIRWYIFRILNLPEGVQRSNIIIYIMFAIFVIFLLISLISYLRNPARNPKLLFFSTMFFLLCGLPFYFLPNHMSSYYMTYALFGPALVYSQIINRKLLLPIIVIYIGLTFLGLDFLSHTHWIILKNTGPIGKF